mmetsp:Transcript_19455/g.36635  ORF Transcript_19455/g.36635 Transcript_19455/m.36635 type:complete len:220 (-) Transcript_19455:21-680(-)
MYFVPVFAVYQSIILPTNGEMRVAPTSAQAIAWHILKRRVMLTWIPSASRTLAAWIPSHVEAILIRTFFEGSTPKSLYIFTRERALAMVASVSKESLASTSVLTTPGTSFDISIPKPTASRSKARLSFCSAVLPSFLPYSTASSRIALYSGSLVALKMREGLVVASMGLYSLIASISPVSATILVYLLRASNWLIALAMVEFGARRHADCHAEEAGFVG